MRTILSCLFDIIRLIFIVQKKGGFKRLVSENILLRHQLQISSRKLKKCPPLRITDRVVFSLFSIFISSKRIPIVAIILSQDTLLKFHRAMVKRKYSILFGNKQKHLERKRTSTALIKFIVETKEKNSTYGCPKITKLVLNVLGISILEETVRKILKQHYRPLPGNGGSWLASIGNSKNKLWSLDFFRIEVGMV